MSGHPDILQTLPRAIRPPDVVDKYMNQIFDTCRRAEETFLAFRLPKEGVVEAEMEEKRRVGDGLGTGTGTGTPKVGALDQDVVMGGMGSERKKSGARARKSIVV